MVWPLWLKKPGLTDRGVATGVTKFRMASGGLMKNNFCLTVFPKNAYFAENQSSNSFPKDVTALLEIKVEQEEEKEEAVGEEFDEQNDFFNFNVNKDLFDFKF